MFFKSIYTPGLSIHSYLLADEKTKECIVVDPTRNIVPYIVEAQNAGLDIVAILETHVHADFVSGAKELKHQLNEKPLIYSSGMGGEEWIPSYADRIVSDGTELKIGKLKLKALHTPGHTPEHIMWVCFDESRSSLHPCLILTGDCLFVGSVGRPDLLGKNETPLLARQLYYSLFEVLSTQPDYVEIFPSHGEGSLCGKGLKGLSSSTLGYERLFNPFLKKESEQSWIKHLLKESSPIPPYFNHLKKMNVQGPPLLNTLKVMKWHEGINEIPLEELFLLDVRHPEMFSTSHLKNSLNIPISSSFTQWIGWMLPVDKPIGIVIESFYPFSDVIEQLRLMGFDQTIWIIELQTNQIKNSLPVCELPMIDVEELSKAQSKALFLLDVRSSEEWRSGHIAGAHHVELTKLPKSIVDLPQDQSIALICRSGQRASIAASLLRQHGFQSVMNVRGGMQAWKQAGLPITSKPMFKD